ncbi:hypothetical protein Taro_052270, partial [Colocasia esculenta]|nr:hypothetical protein [Colocasia esculenta]
LEVTREKSSLVPQTRLQTSLGVANARHQTREGQADYMARLTEDARVALAEEEGAAVDRDLRRFLILVIEKLVLGTRGDPVSCRCLPLLEDLSSIGSYAWGAALLAHLFDSLGTSSRETGVAGFFSLLQVWAYHHLLSLGRGVPRRPGAVSLLQHWQLRRDERSLRLQVTLIHDALDTVPFGHVEWTPYAGEDDAAQPWVERGHPYFGGGGVPDSIEAVGEARPELPQDLAGDRLDSTSPRVARGLGAAWSGGDLRGHSDEDYFRAYARRYGAQVYKGSRRPFDPEGRIASLEGILHSTIQQRDDLQRTMTQLRDEVARAQQMVGGASSSREDPGRFMLEGQLASAVARAEDALARLQEWEAELRDALARMTMLETEMADLRLRPEAGEVARWRQEAEEAARLRAEAGDLRSQLGDERHHCELLGSKMKGLERALALVGCSRSSVSRSGIPSGSTEHYLTGSSERRRNEEEARRREREPEGSETGPRVMAPPSPHLPDGTGESG